MKKIIIFLMMISISSVCLNLIFIDKIDTMKIEYRVDKFVAVSQSFIDGFDLGRQYGTTLERANRI
jgi:hypothetical protein